MEHTVRSATAHPDMTTGNIATETGNTEVTATETGIAMVVGGTTDGTEIAIETMMTIHVVPLDMTMIGADTGVDAMKTKMVL